jgi:hypothetical protein
VYSKAGLWLEAGLFLLTFFVVVPSIAATIGYAAWKGKPKNFSREMYWTVFAAAGAVSVFLMVYAQRMDADVRTWRYPVQIACFGLGALVSGSLVVVALGFLPTGVIEALKTHLQRL